MLYWGKEDMKNISCLMCGMSTCTCPRSYNMKSSSTSGFWRKHFISHSFFLLFFFIWIRFFLLFTFFTRQKKNKDWNSAVFFLLISVKPRWIIPNENCLFSSVFLLTIIYLHLSYNNEYFSVYLQYIHPTLYVQTAQRFMSCSGSFIEREREKETCT